MARSDETGETAAPAGVRAELPARVNLLGNPTDANEGDFCVISLAVELRAQVEVRGASERTAILDGESLPLPAVLPGPVDGPARLVVAALNSLVRHSPEARARLAGRGFRLEYATQIPRGSGMGGSSVLVAATLAALTEWLELDRSAHHPYRLAEWSQWAEGEHAGIAGGYIDFYAPLFGGLCYVDFRGKLHHPPEGEGPFATVERLDPWVDELPLVVVWSGLEHDSGNVHGPMRARYLEEHARGSGPLLDLMRRVGDCGWLGKQALLRADSQAVGELLDRNHALVDEMMRLCGFVSGAGRENNALIAAARAAGARGAKLTGAGGGGSILALAAPGAEAGLAGALERALGELGLQLGRVLRPRRARRGLVITRL